METITAICASVPLFSPSWPLAQEHKETKLWIWCKVLKFAGKLLN